MKKITPILFLLVLGITMNTAATAQSQDKQAAKPAEWFKKGDWLSGLKLAPHQSINQEELYRQYQANNEWWDKAFAFLRTHDLEKLEPGRYVVDTGNVVVSVSEAPAPEMEKVEWESHRNFNDLQYIVRGRAQMGVSPIAQATEKVPYDSKKDVATYTTDGSFFIAEPGTFFIFTPEDVHRPGVKATGYETVKKILIKVRVPR